MERQANGLYPAWPEAELAILREVYPTGGWRAVARRIDKSRAAIIQTAARYRIGRLRKDGSPRKERAEKKTKPDAHKYKWPPLDKATLALQSFGCVVDRTGQLRPMVRVEFGEVA